LASKKYFLALNGSAGAFKDVVADRTVRRLVITEDAAAALQGIAYKIPDDNFTQVFTTQVGPPPAVVTRGQDIANFGAGFGSAIGHAPQTDPAGRTIVGTKMMQLRSASVTATNVWIEEFEA
jgi:hypothetical protein